MRSLLGRFHRPISRGLVNNMLTMNNLGDGSTLSLDFTTMGGVLDPRLTFSRASTATFVNSSGYVAHAGANLLLYSAYADTNWVNYGGYTKSYTTGVTSPIGDATAARITFDAVGKGLFYLSNALGSPNVTGATYTMSAWIRTTSGTSNIRFGDSAVGLSLNIPITNTWTRYSYTYNNALSNSSPVIQSASGTPTGQFEMWGFQLNPGSTAQTYYPTTTAAYHAPRFDYSPTNIGEPRGLLIEQSVQNFITQSQALSGYAPYGMMAISIDGTVPDPMGGVETKKIAASTSATSVFHGFLRNATNAGAATTVTVSIFAKRNNYKYLNLFDGSSATASTRFNLDTGVTDQTLGSGYVSSKMTPYLNGWYRCEMTANVPANINRSWGFQAVADTATYASTGASYIGTGNINDGIYVIGWQVEAGSGASSYVPTGASQVTRAVDTAIIAAGTNFSSWYTGGTTGTFVSNWYGSASSSTARSVIATSDVDDKHLHLYQTASALTLRLADFGALATVTTGNNLTANALTKGAFSYAGTATSLCLNGGTVATNTLGFSVAPTFLSIGGPSTTGTTITDTSVMLNNSIRTIKYYPTRLTDAQIKDITT